MTSMNRPFYLTHRTASRAVPGWAKDLLGVALILAVIGSGVAALYLAHGAQAEAADFQEMSDGAVCRPMKEAPGASLCTRTVRYIVTPEGKAVYLDGEAL